MRDLVHFGVIFAINMRTGMLVLPVALNLFISPLWKTIPAKEPAC